MKSQLLHLHRWLNYVKHILLGQDYVLTRFTGTLKNTDLPLSLNFFGSSNLLADAFLNPGAQQEVLGRFHPLRMQAALESFPTADVTLSPYFPWQTKPDFVVPDYLEAYISLPTSAEIFATQLRGNTRRSVQQAMKSSLDFIEGHSLDDYREFQEQMVAPYMRMRHGEHAYLDSAEHLHAQAARSRLIFVHENGRRLGGFLLILPRVAGCVYFDKIGLVTSVYADKERMRQLNALLYYKMLSMCIELGFSEINLGITPPVFGNGIVWYKSSWGAHFTPNANLQRYALHIAEAKRTAILKHMQAVVQVEANQLWVNLTHSAGVEEDIKRHRFSGLAHVVLVDEQGRVEKRKLE